MKSISPRIMDSAFDFLNENFKSVNAGAEFVVDVMPRLFFYGLYQVDCFTDDELTLFVYLMDIKLLPTSVGSYLSRGLRDPFQKSTADFLNVKPAQILKKFRNLPTFSLVCLEIWAASYWVTGDCARGGADRKAVLKYISKFVGNKSFKS